MTTRELQYDKADVAKCHQLVGKTVFVKWFDKNNKETEYEGKVTHYDPLTDKHTVEYSDGDVKEYLMWRKTFRILNEGHKCVATSVSLPVPSFPCFCAVLISRSLPHPVAVAGCGCGRSPRL